jgi:hypothetical protein
MGILHLHRGRTTRRGMAMSRRVKPIIITSNPILGDKPGYIHRAFRHLEKGKFTPVAKGKTTSYQIPTDILGLTLPSRLTDTIQEVVLVFRKSKTQSL